MAPPRGKKRKSGETDASVTQNELDKTGQTVPTKTTSSEESPRKKRKVGTRMAVARRRKVSTDALTIGIAV